MAQNGDFFDVVVSKRPITCCFSKRGFENGAFAASIRRAFNKARSNRLCVFFGTVPKSRNAPPVHYKRDLLLLFNFSLQIVLVSSSACLHLRNVGVRLHSYGKHLTRDLSVTRGQSGRRGRHRPALLKSCSSIHEKNTDCTVGSFTQRLQQ